NTLLYSSSSNARKTTALSLVTGVKVKLSPAYTTRPILSDGLPLINSAATSLKASRRFGLRSRASILAETSIARTISIPWVEDDLVVTSVERGLAIAIIKNASARMRRIKRLCLNAGNILRCPLNPCTLDILTSASCRFLLIIYQAAAIGIKSSNQKNPGSSNIKFSNINLLYYQIQPNP